MRFTTALRLASLAAVLAVAAPARAEVKIGVVDLQRALSQIGEGRAARAELEKSKDKVDAQLTAKETELRNFEAETQKQSLILSPQQIAQKEQEYQQKVAEAQKLLLKARQELADAEAQALDAISKKMGPIIQQIAEDNAFTVILRKEVIAYSPEALDITSELIRKYDAKYPAPNAPKAAPAAAPKAQPKPAVAPAPSAKK